jgi:hypothetical protein
MDTTLAREALHGNRRLIGVSLNRLGKIKQQPDLFNTGEREQHIEALRTAACVIRTLKETNPEIFDPPAQQLQLQLPGGPA